MLDASVTDALGERPPAPADRRRAAAGRRPRLRQRLPDLRRAAVPQRACAGCRWRSPASTSRSSRASTTRRWPAALGAGADFVVGTIARRRARRSHPTSCSRCTPATPRPTRRWRAPSGGGRRWCWPHPCCHHDIAAQLRRAADAVAVRRADPARHPARAAGRHPHRRAAGLADAAARLPGRRHAVRGEQAHAAQHPAARACAPGRRADDAVRARLRRAGRPRGGCGPGSPSCWNGDAGAASLAALAVLVPFAVGSSPVGGGGPTARRWRHASPTPPSSSRAGWWRATACSSPSTTPATPAGSSSSTATGDTVGVTSWGDAVDVEAVAPSGAGRGARRRHRRQPGRRESVERRRGCRWAAATATMRGDVLRAGLPRRRRRTPRR